MNTLRQVYKISLKKKLTLFGTIILILSLGVISEGIITIEDQEVGELKFVGAGLGARHASSGEIQNMKKAGTLITINEDIVKNVPKLKQVFAGADRNWQIMQEFCKNRSCGEMGGIPPGSGIYYVSVSAEEALITFASIPKLDYYEERMLNTTNWNDVSFIDKNTSVSRFHQAAVQYNQTIYFLVLGSGLRFLDEGEVFVVQSLFYTDQNGQEISRPDTGQAIVFKTRLDGYAKGLVHILEVKNSDGVVEQSSWTSIPESLGSGMELSYSFVPAHGGEYRIKSFVWQTLSGPPLTDFQEIGIHVYEAP